MALHMLPEDMQKTNEHRFSRKFIDRYIQTEIAQNEGMQAKKSRALDLLEEWLNGTYYQSKEDRLNQIRGMDLEFIVDTILVQAAYCQVPEPFTSLTGKIAPRLGFDDRADAIKTTAEMVAVICEADLYDITRESSESELLVQSKIPLSEQLIEYVSNSRYLPPMVCPPTELTHNKQSAYLTHNDTLILGKGNHHDGDIALDVINKQNSIPLCLNKEFLCQVEEHPTFDTSDRDKHDQWMRYKAQGYELYTLMVKQGNRFYLTNKVDKRGRLYTQGYHITTQGTAFKKASVDFAEQETVEGVPS